MSQLIPFPPAQLPVSRPIDVVEAFLSGKKPSTVEAYRQGLVEQLYNRMLNMRFFEITQSPDAPFLGAG